MCMIFRCVLDSEGAMNNIHDKSPRRRRQPGKHHKYSYCCAKITNNSWLHLNLTGLNARPCVHFSLRSPKALGYCFSKSWMKTMRCYRFIFIFDVHVHSFIGRKYVLLCLLHAKVSTSGRPIRINPIMERNEWLWWWWPITCSLLWVPIERAKRVR